jgi:hypothetical protein
MFLTPDKRQEESKRDVLLQIWLLSLFVSPHKRGIHWISRLRSLGDSIDRLLPFWLFSFDTLFSFRSVPFFNPFHPAWIQSFSLLSLPLIWLSLCVHLLCFSPKAGLVIQLFFFSSWFWSLWRNGEARQEKGNHDRRYSLLMWNTFSLPRVSLLVLVVVSIMFCFLSSMSPLLRGCFCSFYFVVFHSRDHSSKRVKWIFLLGCYDILFVDQRRRWRRSEITHGVKDSLETLRPHEETWRLEDKTTVVVSSGMK